MLTGQQLRHSLAKNIFVAKISMMLWFSETRSVHHLAGVGVLLRLQHRLAVHFRLGALSDSVDVRHDQGTADRLLLPALRDTGSFPRATCLSN